MSAAVELYEQLVEVVQHELDLARARQIDELHELAGARAALVSRLPAVAPRTAEGSLRRCAELQEQVTAELARARAEMLEALSRLQQAERTAAGYRPPETHRPVLRAEA